MPSDNAVSPGQPTEGALKVKLASCERCGNDINEGDAPRLYEGMVICESCTRGVAQVRKSPLCLATPEIVANLKRDQGRAKEQPGDEEKRTTERWGYECTAWVVTVFSLCGIYGTYLENTKGHLPKYYHFGTDYVAELCGFSIIPATGFLFGLLACKSKRRSAYIVSAAAAFIWVLWLSMRFFF
jgi:hypothetical protein